MKKKLLVLLAALAFIIFAAIPAQAKLNAPVLSYSGVTSTSVHLSWTDAGAEINYRVAKGSPPTVIATLAANVLAYDVTGLSPSTSYPFFIQAVPSSGPLVNSNTVTVTTLAGGPTNVAPTVSAGSDLAVTLPASASLDGTVSDDGLPNPPGSVTTTWSKVSGPGTVTFGSTSSVDTTASFSVSGTYVLRLTANDSSLSSSDDVQVVVSPAPPTNQAPSVNAGADQTITLPSSATLDGTVTDDGLPNPPATVTTTWSKVSGPGTATFGNASAVDTTASFIPGRHSSHRESAGTADEHCTNRLGWAGSLCDPSELGDTRRDRH